MLLFNLFLCLHFLCVLCSVLCFSCTSDAPAKRGLRTCESQDLLRCPPRPQKFIQWRLVWVLLMLGVRETLCDVYITCMEYHNTSVLDGNLVLVCSFVLFLPSFVCAFVFVSCFYFSVIIISIIIFILMLFATLQFPWVS